MKSSPMRNFLFVSLGLVLGITLTINHSALAEKNTEEADGAPLPLEELRTLAEVFGKIKSDYVESTEDSVLLEGAIKGMLSDLDPHSAYLTPDGYRELQVGTSGEFGGLGIEVGMEDGFVKVISPIDDTPAQRAGIRSGDLIIRIDDTPVKGLSLNDAVKLMRGKPRTKIKLTIVREGQDKPLKITLIRAVIKVSSVKSRMLEPGFGYVRITQFQSNTGENLIDAVSELKKEHKNNLKGLIIDLRNNPGGVLNAAVAVSDAFLEEGLIVYTEGRVNDSQMNFRATPTDIIKGSPLIVMVNGGSASASEIVAGALQDHNRAVIMGTKTFGKGSVQTILPLSNNAALKLTTARYYTPEGRSIQAEGIEPDIKLENARLTTVEGLPIEPVKEANLSGHLESNEETAEDADNEEQEEESLANSDYQLYEALNLLKGLDILARDKE